MEAQSLWLLAKSRTSPNQALQQQCAHVPRIHLLLRVTEQME